MSNTEKTAASLAERLNAEQAKKIEKARTEQELTQKIALAYDLRALPSDFPRVKSIFIHELYGSVGSIHFDDVTPEAAVRIMEAFKPVASGLYNDGTFTGFRPRFSLPHEWEQKPGSKFTEGDGYTLRIDRTADYPTRAEAEWATELAPALFVRVDIRFLDIAGVTPRVEANIDRYSDGRIRSISTAGIKWGVTPPFRIETVRYASGAPENFPPFLIWAQPTAEGSPILAMVKEWAAVCYRNRQNSKLAYLEDKAKGLAPEPATAPAGIRSGTDAQHDCLNTEEARKHAALARKHWREYIEDADPASWPTPPRENFDHYTWACHWLQLHGLYTDPQHDNYKYGSAWL